MKECKKRKKLGFAKGKKLNFLEVKKQGKKKKKTLQNKH
jgi:hypothetical protein